MEEASEIVKLSVDMIGGLEKVDVKGMSVLMKPNLDSDDPHPASTNPQVVKAVVEMLLEAGASEVTVGDMSNPNYRTRDVMRRTGVERADEEASAKTVCFEDQEWVSVEIPGGRHLKNILVARAVYETDRLVDLPVLKTHSLADFSMSMKNFVGAIHPRSRFELHRSSDLEEAVAELNLAFKPDLMISSHGWDEEYGLRGTVHRSCEEDEHHGG